MEPPPTNLTGNVGEREPQRTNPTDAGVRQPGRSSSSRQLPEVDDGQRQPGGTGVEERAQPRVPRQPEGGNDNRQSLENTGVFNSVAGIEPTVEPRVNVGSSFQTPIGSERGVEPRDEVTALREQVDSLRSELDEERRNRNRPGLETPIHPGIQREEAEPEPPRRTSDQGQDPQYLSFFKYSNSGY